MLDGERLELIERLDGSVMVERFEIETADGLQAARRQFLAGAVAGFPGIEDVRLRRRLHADLAAAKEDGAEGEPESGPVEHEIPASVPGEPGARRRIASLLGASRRSFSRLPDIPLFFI
jgi:hypothetical protein